MSETTNNEPTPGRRAKAKAAGGSISDQVVAALSKIDADPAPTEEKKPLGRRVRRGSPAETSQTSSASTPESEEPTRGRSAIGAALREKVAAVQENVSSPPAGGRKMAMLRIQTVNPYSVARMSFFVSVALGVVSVIAVTVMWTILNLSGVWDSINTSVADVLGGEDGASFDIRDYVGTGRVLGFTFIVAVVNIFLITGIGWLCAFLYNAIAALSGGVVIRVRQEN